MTPLHTLTFDEFADAIRATGGMNRWPQLGQASENVTYSVHMNGERAAEIPDGSREHEFRDVAIHALTQNLGLDPRSFRDNVKVAELLALRHAYLSTILDASFVHTISPAVQAEYDSVSNGFSHPLVAREIAHQRAHGALLAPALLEAETVLGHKTTERAAGGISNGKIISQNEGFTIQTVGDGTIVAHENRRLESLPAIGDDVTVAYYRGRGQVIERISELRIGSPFVETETGDLAVNLFGADGRVEHVVMFNSIAMVHEFAVEQEMGKGFVIAAMDAREAAPKQAAERPKREVAGGPYFDVDSGGLAVDYIENSMRYTAIFHSAKEMAQQGALVLSQEAVLQAQTIEKAMRDDSDQRVSKSFAQAEQLASGRSVKAIDTNTTRASGAVIALTGVHVVQDRGRNEVSIHDKRRLDRVPMIGEQFSVEYRGGRGEVQIRNQSKDRAHGR
jgi:hypothetical protein